MNFQTPGRHNPIWKSWAKIGRGKDSRFFLEHPEAVREGLTQGHPLEQVLLEEKAYQQDRDAWEELSRQFPEVRWYLLPDGKLTTISRVGQAQGVCAVCTPPEQDWKAVEQRAFLLVAWEMSDPGNLGTLIRTCAALADGGLVLLGGCSPWSAKVARSSAGALFRVPLYRFEKTEGILDRLLGANYKVFATAPSGGKDLQKAEFSGRDAVLLGNESHGLPAEILQQVSGLTIAMRGEVDSLNVAMAGGILTYCWACRHSG